MADEGADERKQTASVPHTSKVEDVDSSSFTMHLIVNADDLGYNSKRDRGIVRPSLRVVR